MARRIKIPLVVDLILTDEPNEIRALANQANLDRGFRPRGPLMNRVLVRRLKSALSLDGKPLESARMRGDRERQRVSGKLTELFAPGRWDADTLASMADHVRGDTARPVGELAQEAIGRMFDTCYTADANTWAAARSIDSHLQMRNPVRRLLRRLSGALGHAQDILGRAANGDTGAVHGTGVAVHNLALSLERMQSLWTDEENRARLGPKQAALSALAAPRTVIRVGTGHGDTVGGPVRPGTLVALNLRRAASRSMDANLAFLGSSWSRCPAEAWVMALLAEVWRKAGERR